MRERGQRARTTIHQPAIKTNLKTVGGELEVCDTVTI